MGVDIMKGLEAQSLTSKCETDSAKYPRCHSQAKMKVNYRCTRASLCAQTTQYKYEQIQPLCSYLLCW